MKVKGAIRLLLFIGLIAGMGSCKLFKKKDCDCPDWSKKAKKVTTEHHA